MSRIVTFQSQNISNAVDVTKCVPFSYENCEYRPVTPNIFQNIVSVLGKGFLSHAYIEKPNSISQIKIVVDGVVFYQGKSSDNSYGTIGFFQENELFYNAAGTVIGVRKGGTNTPSIQYGISSPASLPASIDSNVSIILSQPIYFQSSLIVAVAGNDTGARGVSITGGVY